MLSARFSVFHKNSFKKKRRIVKKNVRKYSRYESLSSTNLV